MLGLCLGVRCRQPDRTSPRLGVFVYSSGRKMKDDARVVAALASRRTVIVDSCQSAKKERNREERVVRAASQPAASQREERNVKRHGRRQYSGCDGMDGSGVMGMDRDGDGNGGVSVLLEPCYYRCRVRIGWEGADAWSRELTRGR